MIKDVLIAIGIIVVSVFLLLAFLPTNDQVVEIDDQSIDHRPAETQISEMPLNSVSINVPAVDNQGNGVVAKLKVQAIPGEGRILTNINQLFFWVDTQFSIRVAEAVAQEITGADLSKVDLIYTIETDASVIEGGSAGAALTVATIAVLKNKTLPTDVMITGTINPDGTIGPIGGVFAKAKASKDAGAKIFLVPEGQGSQVNYRPERSCEQVGPVTFCRTEYKTERIDISGDVGIQIVEVSDINETLEYFLG